MTEFRTAYLDQQAEECAVNFFFQGHNRMAPVDFKPRQC